MSLLAVAGMTRIVVLIRQLTRATGTATTSSRPHRSSRQRGRRRRSVHASEVVVPPRRRIRRPRPPKLEVLPVRQQHLSSTLFPAGKRLRRQTRQVIDNSRWRLQGFYCVWRRRPRPSWVGVDRGC